MNQNYIGYGVFINSEYHSLPDFDTACDYFDSAVALGQVECGSVVGWYDLDGYQTLYTHTDVVRCELTLKSPVPKSLGPETAPTKLAS